LAQAAQFKSKLRCASKQQSDQAMLNDRAPAIKDADIEIRSGFIRKVYGIVCMQLLLTTLVAGQVSTVFKGMEKSHAVVYAQVASVLSLVVMCAMMCCKNAMQSFPTNYLLLFGFTFFESIVIGFICSTHSQSVVLLSFFLTGLIVGCLTLYATFTGSDFTQMGDMLFAGLIGLCIAGFGVTLMGMMGISCPILTKFYAACGILLFTFYLVYDTQLIMGNHSASFGPDDYVFAAMNLYLDIINLFVYILQFLGDNK